MDGAEADAGVGLDVCTEAAEPLGQSLLGSQDVDV